MRKEGEHNARQTWTKHNYTYESVIVKPNFQKYQQRKESKSVNFTEVIYPINYEMLLILFPQNNLKDLQKFLQGKSLLRENH